MTADNDSIEQELSRAAQHVAELPSLGERVMSQLGDVPLKWSHIRTWWPQAAAAVLTLAVLTGLWLSWGTASPMSAYAELKAAIENSKASEWVHCSTEEGETSGEIWVSFSPSRHINRVDDGRVIYFDWEKNRQYKYDPEAHEVTISFLGDLPEDHQALKSMLGFMEVRLEDARKKNSRIVKSDGRLEGSEVVIYEVQGKVRAYDQSLNKKTGKIEYKPAGDAKSIERFVVDPVRQRVIRMVHGSQRKDQEKPELHTFDLDYPATGPEDIYAAGVPRDAKVVDRTATEEAKTLKAAVDQAATDFAPSYVVATSRRLIDWAGSNELAVRASITITYVKGDRVRIERYNANPPKLTWRDADSYHKEVLATVPKLPDGSVEAMLAWTRKRQLGRLWIYDGKTCAVFFRASAGAVLRGTRHNTNPLPDIAPAFWCRPILLRNTTVLPPKAGLAGELVGLESADAFTETWHFSPQNGYLCEQYEKAYRYGEPDNHDVKSYRVLAYGRTDSGKPYPFRVRMRHQVRRNDMSAFELVHRVDTRRDVPDELFDVETVDINKEKLFAPK